MLKYEVLVLIKNIKIIYFDYKELMNYNKHKFINKHI